MEEPQVPPIFGRYKDAVMIGSGGMGAVYRAVDPTLGRVVAIKVLTNRQPKYVERFRREAQVLAKIAHPAIVQVYEIVGSDDAETDPYIVMEFFPGRALDAQIKDGPMAGGEVVSVLRQAAEGLKRAHAHQVIHRDIKPANLMVSGTGEVKILDFGIAKALDAQSNLTGNNVLGTPYYMSPEQAKGLTLDPRTDIYSLGITAFHLLTGRRPFEAKSKVEVMTMQVKAPLPRIADLVACEPRLAALVEKMCAKDPAARFQSCQALIEGLAALEVAGKRAPAAASQNPPPRPAPKAPPRPTAPPSRPSAQPPRPSAPPKVRRSAPPEARSRTALAVTLGTLGALLVLGAGASWFLRRQVLPPAGPGTCALTNEGTGRCSLGKALGANRPGEIWQDVYVDGAKRGQVVYDRPLPEAQDELSVDLSARMKDLSPGKHTLAVRIYRQPAGSQSVEALAGGELVVQK